eukprot:CAMPEP_0196796854 /NCGR_PEP_ID=MMETSP1104-20130614/38166_1 /TAXON_ID=33652 /ORGANISM="Cafeteria sp., Strain Caron Lab Isolate" /LENGTH=69 /DNA_ID=CAMNT_0042167253 /DNA_START=29 /DNA_END=235 /DNA_ORIENTATION=-
MDASIVNTPDATPPGTSAALLRHRFSRREEERSDLGKRSLDSEPLAAAGPPSPASVSTPTTTGVSSAFA